MFDKLINPESLQGKDRIEHQINKELKHFKTGKKIPGLKVWKYDVSKPFLPEEVVEVYTKPKAVVEDVTPNLIMEPGERPPIRHKVFLKPTEICIQALNHKNAVKKFQKIIIQFNKRAGNDGN